jgi:hypothetical protein
MIPIGFGLSETGTCGLEEVTYEVNLNLEKTSLLQSN